MRTFGAINPIIVDRKLRIVAGHARWEAAKRLKLDAVPVLLVDHLSDDELRLYAIADNRIAERAGWDDSILAIEFADLEVACPDISLSVSGFDLPKIDWICAKETQEDWTDLDKQVEPSSADPVTRLGDVWLLGDRHRLICGDSTNPDVLEELMSGERASLVGTDPPYNLRARDYSGNGKKKHRDFAMGAGEMSRSDFTNFLARSFQAILPHLTPGAMVYAFMDWKHVRELIAAGDVSGLELLNICVWDKGKGGMGAFYRSAHELVCVFKNGKDPHKNRVQLGRHGRDRTNIWRYEGMNSFARGREKALGMHATVKPVQMISDLLLDASDRGDIVFDGFGGSGTTMIAAEKTRRLSRLVELDPTYCDTIVSRFQQAFGIEAIHAELGLTFAEVLALRSTEGPDDV
jgi:DNA modification methylase